jgi:hypothetical protein
MTSSKEIDLVSKAHFTVHGWRPFSSPSTSNKLQLEYSDVQPELMLSDP